MNIKLRVFVLILACLVAAALPGCGRPAAPATLVDDMGRQVTITEIPQRIVSHVPSITEMLFALGLGDRVVGVSDYCDYPEAVKAKPKVGDYFNPSVERIVALNPDLVVTDGHSESIKGLIDLGINFVVVDPKDIAAVMRDIELLGRVTGREREAGAVTAGMNQRIAEVTRLVQAAPPVRVFYTFAVTDLNNPWTAGPGSFVDSLVALAGGKNVVPGPGAWVQVSVEQILGADPELIVVDTSMGSAVESLTALRTQLREHPAWKGITAVRQDRLFPIDGNLLNRPGPRIAEGLEQLARIIHPELFKAPPK